MELLHWPYSKHSCCLDEENTCVGPVCSKSISFHCSCSTSSPATCQFCLEKKWKISQVLDPSPLHGRPGLNCSLWFQPSFTRHNPGYASHLESEAADGWSLLSQSLSLTGITMPDLIRPEWGYLHYGNVQILLIRRSPKSHQTDLNIFRQRQNEEHIPNVKKIAIHEVFQKNLQ